MSSNGGRSNRERPPRGLYHEPQTRPPLQHRWHSQGTMALIELIRDLFGDDEDSRHHLVAAYPIGGTVTYADADLVAAGVTAAGGWDGHGRRDHLRHAVGDVHRRYHADVRSALHQPAHLEDRCHLRSRVREPGCTILQRYNREFPARSAQRLRRTDRSGTGVTHHHE